MPRNQQTTVTNRGPDPFFMRVASPDVRDITCGIVRAVVHPTWYAACTSILTTVISVRAARMLQRQENSPKPEA
jgi:hypothetical protein